MFKTNTDTILATFRKTVEKLEAYAKSSRNRAASDADVAYEYTQRHEEKLREADRAEAAAAKLKELLQ